MASKITYLTDKEFYIGVSKKLNISPEKVKDLRGLEKWKHI